MNMQGPGRPRAAPPLVKRDDTVLDDSVRSMELAEYPGPACGLDRRTFFCIERLVRLRAKVRNYVSRRANRPEGGAPCDPDVLIGLIDEDDHDVFLFAKARGLF